MEIINFLEKIKKYPNVFRHLVGLIKALSDALR